MGKPHCSHQYWDLGHCIDCGKSQYQIDEAAREPEPKKIEYFSQAQVMTLPDKREYLLVTIKIQCPICGEIEMQLPGHHIRAIRNLLVEYVDLYPQLTHKDDELQMLAGLQQARDEGTKH